MGRFNCDDCVKKGTCACTFGDYNGRDFSDICLDILVDADHAYIKGQQYLLKDVLKKLKRSDLVTFNQAIDYLQERLNELEEITDEKG